MLHAARGAAPRRRGAGAQRPRRRRFAGRGPTNPAMIRSASSRSIGNPPAASSAHSSSAADSARAVATAWDRSAVERWPSCRVAACAASPAQRARRSGRSAQLPSTQSGRRYPSGRTGCSGSPISGSAWVNRSSGRDTGIDSRGSSRRVAHTNAGSARQPPASRRCTTAMSQHAPIRTPASTSIVAVSIDHHTHRGRRTVSMRATTAAGSSTSTASSLPSGPAMPSPTPRAIATPTRTPRPTPTRRSHSTASPSRSTFSTLPRHAAVQGRPTTTVETPVVCRPVPPVPARAPQPSAYGGGDAVDELVVEAAGATMVQRADAIVRWAQPSPLNRHRTSTADRLATALSPSVVEPATHRRWWRTVRSGRRVWPSPSRCHPRRSAARPRDRPTHRRGSAR